MLPTRRWVVNYRFLTVSLVVFAALSLATYAWHGHVVERNATALLKHAAQQEAEGEWRSAAQSLKRYLALVPHDVPARVRLAEDFDHDLSTAAERFKALELLAAAVAAAPNAAGPRRRHLALTFESGDYTAALDHADLLEKVSPADPAALKYRALALAAQWELKKEKSLAKVVEAFEAAQQANPGDAALAAPLARFYRVEMKQPSEEQRCQQADAIMDTLVEKSVDRIAALVARHDYRHEFRLAGGDADLDRALELAEEEGESSPDPMVFLAAGTRAQDRGDAAEAIRYLRRAIAVAPRKPRAYLLLSQVYRHDGDRRAAVQILEQGLDEVGDNTLSLQAQLASVRIEAGQYDVAQTLLAALQAQVSKLFGREQTEWLAMIHALRAEMLLARKDYRSAIPVLTRVLVLRQGGAAYGEKAAGDAQLHVQLGVCYSTLGQWDQAALAYQAAAALQPQSSVLRLAAAEAWDAAGWLDEAIRQCEEALASDDVPPTAWQFLAQALYRRQVQLPPAKRDWSGVRHALERAQASPADAPSVQLLRGEYELASGQFDLAAETLESVEDRVLDVPRLAVRLAQCYERLGHPERADRVADQMSGDEASLMQTLLKCELLLRRDRGDEAERLLTESLGRLPDEQQKTVRYRLALIYLYRGKRDDARRELLAVSSANEDARPLQLLAELALEAGDWSDARRQVQRLQELEVVAGQTGWQFYRAQRLIGEGLETEDAQARQASIHEAGELAGELERLRPYWAPTYLLKGRLAQLGDKPDDEASIAAYSQAVRLGERRVQLYQELISLLFRCHRMTEGAALIDRLRIADDVPEELVSLALAADVSQGNVPRAVRLAANEVRRHPEDSICRLRLGQLLALNLPADAEAREQQLGRAESELKRAQELAPRDARVWSALLAFYHTTDQADQARQTLQQVAREDFLDEKDKPFFLAQGYAMLGDEVQARKLYIESVAANPDRVGVLVQAGDFFFRSEPERAERYLRHALEVAPGEPTASRKLAALVAVRSDSEQQMDEVWQLLNASSSQGMPDVADDRLRAVLLLRRGGAGSRKHAQQLLESLVIGGSQIPLDRLLLARLYEAQGEIEKAREQLELLVQTSQADPAHLAAYAEHLLRTAERDATARTRLGEILDRLSTAEPESESFRTLSLRARWLKLVGRADEASAIIAEFQAQPVPALDGARRTQRLLMVAGLYDSLELDAQAEGAYRQAIELSPGAYRPLATWLARHKRSTEAIELCRQAAAEEKSAAPAAALAAVLTVGSATPDQRAAAEPLLKQALAQYPDDRGLLFGMSTLRLVEQNNDEAEQLLRRFLRLEPRNVPAMNNLAMLLADRHDGAGEALALVDRAMAIVGAQSELFDTKGWVLLEQKRFPEAETSFREALAMPPDSPRYRFHLALTYRHQGKDDDAHRMLERALADNLKQELLSPKEREELRKLESVGK